MKLCRLDLIAFGPFDKTSLDLSDGDPGLHVIYGDNEDGKSTTLRATLGLLFGIEGRTSDDHVFKKAQLRIGGRLRRTNGDELSFVRKKGNKDTLRRPDVDAPLPQDALEPFLGGIGEQLFSSLYGIDHAELVAGGQAILDQTGDLGQALYSAATGTASLKKILDDLEQRADQLFRPRASTSRIYTALGEYATRVKGAKDATLLSSTWTKLQREHDSASHSLGQLDAERVALRRDLSQHQRIRRARPNLARRQNLTDSLARLGKVVDLAEAFEQNRHEAAEQRRTTAERLEQVVDQIQRIQDEESNSQVPATLIEHAASIEHLFRKLGRYESLVEDRPAQDAKRRQHDINARELLKAIPCGFELEDVESMRPLLALKRSIQDLAARHQKLAMEEQNAELALQKASQQSDALQRELEQVEQSEDSSRLSAAVSAAQRAGDLDTQLDDARSRLSQRREQCQVELARLGLWNGSLEQLERTPLPDSETIGMFETSFQDATDRLRGNIRELEDLNARRSELTEQLGTLEQSGPVPCAGDLVAARARRDAGWALVRHRCFDQAEVDEEIQLFCEGRALPDAYEQAVRGADEVADQLRSDADRVQQREILEAELHQANRRIDTLQADVEQHGRAADTVEQQWLQVWVPAGIQPRTAREMATWLRGAETLRQHIEELRLSEREVEGLTHRHTHHFRTVAKELEVLGERLGEVFNDQQERLDSLVARALALLENLDRRVADRRALEKDLREAHARATRVEEEKTGLTKRRGLWEREWHETVTGFDFLAETSVARVLATLDQIEDLFRKIDEANSLTGRIRGIDERIADYQVEVDEFGSSIDRPRAEQPVDRYVVQLHEGLVQAREVETALKSLRRQREDLEKEEAELRATLRSLDGRFTELRREAQVDHDEQLREAGQRASRARELRSQVAQLEQQILEAGDGHSIEQLCTQAEDLGCEELDLEITRLEEKLDGLEQRRGDLFNRRAELNHHIGSTGGEGAAAQAAEQADQALSGLREDVRTYLRMRAAALMLANQIETYRRDNQAPVLRRASELFARLTLGSYKGLQDELDKNNRPVLRGVRPDAQEVPVDGMSEGTRDQLYLALRLATLEQHLDAGRAMPFVVDDILVGFDDHRTEACLRVLADLATRTQVLVFTHHRRLAEMARSLGETEGIFVHELPRRSAGRVG